MFVLDDRRRLVRVAALLLTLLPLLSSGPLASTSAPRSGPPAQPQSPEGAPLPELGPLIRDVRAGLRTDEQLLAQYTFKERRRDVNVSRLGKVQLGPWREFEVYPSEVPGQTYKRLISVNGVPLAPAELERRDAAHRKRVLDQLEQRRVETPAQRDKRLAKSARELREEQDVIDDVFAVYQIALVGREVRDGQSTIVATLTPRKNARTKSDAGKFLKKVKGKAWITEADRQVIRTELEAIDDITFGLGLLARMHKGSTIMFRRTKVNGEIWLPAEARYRVVGKTLVFRKFALESTTEFSDYKKFGVSTTEEVAPR